MRFGSRITSSSLLLLVVFAVSALSIAGVARAVDPVPVPHNHGKSHAMAEPIQTTEPGSGQSGGNSQLHELDAQIKAMREEFHSQLDPLQQQITALKAKYEPQLKALEEQRHDLAESGKPQAIQDLDRQEASELAALADKEKAEIDRVRQQYADQRRDVQVRYKEEREKQGGGKK